MKRDTASAEWALLGDRLRELNPERYAETLECVREIVEAQEVLAGAVGRVARRPAEGDVLA